MELSAKLGASAPRRKDDRIIIHFADRSGAKDYDCFYASVFEAENPALKSLPLAVQQKQIIVTCNYEARRRGLRKLQLITEAKQVCPDVVIVLGEELGRFRDASKMLYKYLEAFTWNKKVERLGFDEVFMDVTDLVEYNMDLLNGNDLAHSFFQLSKDDPTVGFEFNATSISGHQYPDLDAESVSAIAEADEELQIRLVLGSHLARHLRHQLEENKGYTSTVGISTSKLLAKLVGNLHKPKGQTTLMPPYSSRCPQISSNVTTFIDSHDIGKIPGIGFKMSHKIRNHILGHVAKFDMGLIYGGTMEAVTVASVRINPTISPDFLEKLLGGPGSERGIGTKVWSLINGVDDTEVKEARRVPRQISIEDSYIRLNTIAQVLQELRILSTSLIRRMHVDLLEVDEDVDEDADGSGDDGAKTLRRRWIAHPKTVRLSTRPRPPRQADGTVPRTFNRISRSAPLPVFIFDQKEGIDALVSKLVAETLLPMFRRLHPDPAGWNLSLMNICVTNMVETASDAGDGRSGGRDIGRMFKRQVEVLKEWRVEDRDVPPEEIGTVLEGGEARQEGKEGEDGLRAESAAKELERKEMPSISGSSKTEKAEPSAGHEADSQSMPRFDLQRGKSETAAVQDSYAGAPDFVAEEGNSNSNIHYMKRGEQEQEQEQGQGPKAQDEEEEDDEPGWIEDEEESGEKCPICGVLMPVFAMAAHERFHGFS